jgi:hypothetical protein
LVVDDAPPAVSRIRIRSTATPGQLFSFHFKDNLSGVDYDELKTYIDGRIVIPEIDGEHRKASYQPKIPLQRGSHQLTIHLTDNQGNTTAVERRFVLR